MHYFLNIGSNLGQRRLNISRAVAALEREFGWFEASHTVESAPQGFDSPNHFLNMGVHLISDLDPVEMLGRIKAIERSLCPEPHRTPSGLYADRTVDIDIIAADEAVVDLPDLQIPHPRMAERRFVLLPMQELAPGWRHPLLGLTPSQLIDRLPEE